MYAEISLPENPARAYPPPAWCIDLSIEVRLPEHSNKDISSLEVVALAVDGKVGEVQIWPRSWQSTYNSVSKTGQNILIARLPMTREIVKAIEDKRTGSVRVTLDILISVRPLRLEANGYSASSVPSRADSLNSQTIQWTIERDPWIQLLTTLGWSEIEVFEVTTGRGREDTRLADAMKELRAAENAFRQRLDPNVVLMNCYRAFDSASKQKGAGKKLEGFALMLEDGFPGEVDKRECLDSIIRSINEFAHLGRHGQYPERRVTWAEALFILRQTLSVFDVLSNNQR